MNHETILNDYLCPSRRFISWWNSSCLFIHGGSVQLMDYDKDSKNVHVKLTGSCAGCAASIFTVKLMMEKILKEKLPDAVESVTHEEGEVVNPFYVWKIKKSSVRHFKARTEESLVFPG